MTGADVADLPVLSRAGCSIVMTVLALCGIAFGVGFLVAEARAQMRAAEFRKEAVKVGHAEWVVDEDGKTEWRWKP